MFSAVQRPQQLARLDRETFDLVIIGAGINGAAVARAAALRGYSVALLDQQDLGAGTSSRSSRLVHGGLRYLEHLELGLVFESLAERALLARVARHIVRPLEFVLPVYDRDRVGLLQARLGLTLYDLLALFRNPRNHHRLSPRRLASTLPGILEVGLKGGLSYFDYRTDDGRLVLENAISASEAGAVVATHARVEGFEAKTGTEKLVRVRDQIGGGELVVRGRAILCAAGPWTDRVLRSGPRRRWLRPTKGVHLVVPRQRLDVGRAVVMQHPTDGRVLFVLPFYERTVIGTTDTEFEADPLQVTTTAQDVSYLLEAANHYFPGRHLDPDDVFASWAGVRPLVAADADHPSAVSREERIETRSDGVVVVAGGKLTTYRRIAEASLDAAAAVIASSGGPPARGATPLEKEALPGAVGLDDEAHLDSLIHELTDELGDGAVARELSHAYGVRAREVARLARERPRLAERMVPELPLIWAQVIHAARRELVLTLADVLVRRTQLVYRDRRQGLDVAVRASRLLAGEVGWSAAERQRQVEDYRRLVKRGP